MLERMSYLLWVASIADALAAILRIRKAKINQTNLHNISRNEGREDMYTPVTLSSPKSSILNSIICKTSTDQVPSGII
jgi:hypothetical protein